jgi:penicillin-binding protein 1A
VVSGGAGGSISLRDATANSVNTVYAQLVTDIGPDTMDEMAKKMGVTSPLSGYPADVLGASDVTVLDQSNGFATIANGGVHHDPTAIAKVEFPDGEVDVPEDPEGTRVVSDGVAYTVADVMTGTLDYGTAACCDIPCPAAGKTGTTEEQADAWFVGYTPHISTAVWVGNPDSRVALPGYGADLAAPIWHDYMSVAAAQPCDDFPLPENPADLSGFYSDHTVDPNYDSTSTTPDATTTDPTKPNPDDATGGDNGYNPDLYAPGAGQDPAPTPDPPAPDPPADTGGGNTGGPTGGAGGVNPN